MSLLGAALAVLTLAPTVPAAGADGEESPDPFMGDYSGTLKMAGGETREVAWQLIPTGGRNYRVNVLPKFDARGDALFVLKGFVNDERAGFVTNIDFNADTVAKVSEEGLLYHASRWRADRDEDDVLAGAFEGRESGEFSLKQVRRESPNLGREAPDGAVILFNGGNLDAWSPVGRAGEPAPWEVVDGVMQVRGGDIMTRETFGDHELHIEFRTPYMPQAGGQGRGNSGVYLQGRYEVQVLDSYGLEGADNECGGIYQVARPKVNMCAPPLQWQSYDITFTAPRFDGQGNKSANARITVVHNGVVIHDNVELPGPTGGAIDGDEHVPGPLKLQDHTNPVQFRNIWAVKK